MTDVLKGITIPLFVLACATPAFAQEPSSAAAQQQADEQPQTAQQPAGQPATREAAIEQEQADKAQHLHTYVPNKAERIFEQVDTILAGGTLRWHPFFENAY